MTTSRQYQPLDDLRRDDLPKAPKAIADVLDEWVSRKLGIISGSHDVGLFLDLLADEGYTVITTPKPITEVVDAAFRWPNKP